MSAEFKLPITEQDYESIWGDACLYMGMFQVLRDELLPEERGNDGVYLCQSQVDGSLWRNPSEALAMSSKWAHGTSNDMLTGFTLGATKEGAIALAKYLSKHRNRLSEGGDSRTFVRPSGLYHMKLVMGSWGTAFRAFSFPLFLFAVLGSFAPPLMLLIQILTAWKGYQLHLCICTWMFYLKYGIVKEGGWWHKLCAKLLNERSKRNLFVWFLENSEESRAAFYKQYPHVWNTHYKSPYQDAWNAAWFSQNMADRNTSAIYARFVDFMKAVMDKRQKESSNG